MEIGREVWISAGDDWISGTIVQRVSPLKVMVELENGDSRVFHFPLEAQEEASNIKLRDRKYDPSTLDDLTRLENLHEPGIVDALQQRFQNNIIYTNTGPMLIAINPYRTVNIYDADIMRNYYEANIPFTNGGKKKTLAPHIFSIAAEAYNAMMNPAGATPPNQSILISGESGSGKTETAKFIMQYLANVSCYNRNGNGVEKKVLESNPILESFGNSRTLRNDNSSRFGKFIKMHFTHTGELTGASIQTYLLEKVRLVSQSSGERNYHIFYELCGGASDSEKAKLNILSMKQYNYLGNSGCFTRKDGVSDQQQFLKTRHAMKVIGFDVDSQYGIFKIISGILHLGNIVFKDIVQGNTHTTQICPSSYAYKATVSKLFGIDPAQLEFALCSRKIKAGNDRVVVSLTSEQAANARDALAKAAYGRLFEWLVEKINDFLEHGVRGTHFIGILDIFGFEIFPKNSFEQLCINYANETLQQQFNEFFFKKEQEDYALEGIQWDYVDFPDNQLCVQLIAEKHVGILGLIDEECRVPKGTDASFSHKMFQRCAVHSQFEATSMQKAAGCFAIHHYAGKVVYHTQGFLDKNKDQLYQEAILLLRSSKSSFNQTLFENAIFRSTIDSNNERGRSAFGAASVGSQFKSQLIDLMSTINATGPHYVRCLKPNELNSPTDFSRERIISQLRCSGVLEGVRVARAGFPIRMTHEEFVRRYRVITHRHVDRLNGDASLLRQTTVESARSQACSLIRELSPLLMSKDSSYSSFKSLSPQDEKLNVKLAFLGLQIGNTKTFMRKLPFDKLEKCRNRKLIGIVIRIQSVSRGYLCRSHFLKLQNALVTLQCRYRWKKIGEKRVVNVTIIQKTIRRYMAQKKYQKLRHAVTILQIAYHRRQREQFLLLFSKASPNGGRIPSSPNNGGQRTKSESELKDEVSQLQSKDMLHVNSFDELFIEMTNHSKSFDLDSYKIDDNYKPNYIPSPISSSLPYSSSKEPFYFSNNESSALIEDVPSQDSHHLSYSSREHESGGSDERLSLSPDRLSSKYSLSQVPPVFSFHTSPEMTRKTSILSSPSSPEAVVTSPNSNKRGDSRSIEEPVEDTYSTTYSTSLDNPLRNRAMTSKSTVSTSSRFSRAVNLPKLGTVTPKEWVKDDDRFSCHICNKRFSMFRRKHHCRACGEIICGKCSLYHRINTDQVRVCVSCVAFHSCESPIVRQQLGGGGSGSGGSRHGSSNANVQSVDTGSEHSDGSGNDGWNNPWPQPPVPDNEKERLAALRVLNIHSIGKEGMFNMFCDVAARALKCPIAAVSIVEEDDQILLANMGMSQEILPRELSFCAHTICQDVPLVVLDAKVHPIFMNNPMVKGHGKLRFYAGAPIFSPNGYALGTVCVYDTHARKQIEPEQIAVLQNLCALASEKMNRNFRDVDI